MVQQPLWAGESIMFLEIFVEGGTEVPTVREILQRRFNLVENTHFRIHPPQGQG